MSDRDLVLARLRAAQTAAGRSGVPAPPPAAIAGAAADRERAADAVLDLLAARIADYGATVLRTDPDGAAEAVGRAIAGLDPTTVAVAGGLDGGWHPERGHGGPAVVDGDALDVAALDRDVVALTTCRVAIAETGTLVLDHAEGQGPRRLTLVPDRHVCVVPAERVVHGVDEAMARLTPRRPTTFVSGGSATSDIELQRVEGVHGPRTLVVVLVG